MSETSVVAARRTIEALRSGVPNRDAVRHLGVFQGDLTQRFSDLLVETEQAAESGEESMRSVVISGGFGSGKSHLLEYLRHEALEHGYVCSHIVISKETPLFNPLRLLRTATECASVPGKAGKAVSEILFSDKFDVGPLSSLEDWARCQPGPGERTAALIELYRKSAVLSEGEELRDKIAREWSGYPMKVADIRSALKEIGQHRAYHIIERVTQTELSSLLWQFLPRLFHAAGYKGWVVLFDELELMLRYSKLQRARSYAQIARSAGAVRDYRICGVLPVFAMTDDFRANAEDTKHDSEIPEWLRYRGKPGDEQLAKEAELGMKLLKRPMQLRSARNDELELLKNKVRELHSVAFGWDAPEPKPREVRASASVREHIKSWVTEWDMMVLYPDYRPKVMVEEVVHDYSEDPELSVEADAAEDSPQ